MENSVPPPLPAAASSQTSGSTVAGFWRRVFAACIDSFLLGLVGWILGLFFFRQFMHMGNWGRLLGFVIALLYFVPLNSRIGAGQTLGKRALRIRVTSANGETLGLLKSFARSCALFTPFFLNGVQIPLHYIRSPLGIAVSLGIFGLGLSIIYLFVFNSRTRQSLHDLLVGSYVVPVGSEQGEKRHVWRGHFLIVGIILLLAAILPVVTSRLAQVQVFAEIMPAYEALLHEPEVTGAQLFSGQNYSWDAKGGGRNASVVDATVRLNRSISDKNAEAEKFARIILQKYPGANSKDYLKIGLVEGYDIGIASAFVSQNFNYSLAEWRQRLDSSGAANAAPTPLPSPK
jgi:uncharacterized RDD family membrane protein YckC